MTIRVFDTKKKFGYNFNCDTFLMIFDHPHILNDIIEESCRKLKCERI